MYDSTSYSFNDVICTIQNPLAGQKVITGEGIGSISTTYTDDNTQSDLGADGAVMVSKVVSHRGQIVIEVQQTSSANKWLHNLANLLDSANVSKWLSTSIRITEKFSNGLLKSASRAALVKRPDTKDEQQGGKVSWTFMSPDLEVS
ncbi:phage protein [Muricomes intestini]|jgi:alpha-acetolactate decarboxylase|uniref:phage protein n=1 Tax=Muricomes intestini TaxID=1796634 RepID=UPI002FDEED5E